MEDGWIVSIVLSSIILFYFLIKLLGKILILLATRTDFAKWSDTPKDLVILHTHRGKTVPSPSPFALKLETFLRAAKINHKVEHGGAGPKGKIPWISINGEHIGDSQIIIDYLTKKFAIDMDNDYSPEQLSKSHFIRISLEEHLYWAAVLWRWVSKDGLRTLNQILRVPPKKLWLYKKIIPGQLLAASKAQGMGRHSEEEIYEVVKKELKSLSTILGNKKFILGDEFCSDDSAIFGSLAQMIWAMPGSPYEHFFKDEFKNLKEYCERIKGLYYPDWEKILS